MTRRGRRFGVLALSIFVGCGIGAGLDACAHPTPASVTTSSGKVAYQSLDALDALQALQHAAIAARRSNVISTPAMRTIVKATIAGAVSINAVIDTGMQGNAVYYDVDVALTQAETVLSGADKQKLAVELGAAHTILRALAQ
jgi:hypothetical protein